MAQTTSTIRQRIQLVGAEEIKAQLAEMGSSGERAIAAIDKAVKTANSTTTGFAAAVGSMKGEWEEVGKTFAPVGEALTKLKTSFGEFKNNLGEMADKIFPHFKEALALVTAGSIAAIGELTKSAAANVRETDNMAASMGMSVENFEALKFAASAAGIEQSKFMMGLARFTVEAGKAHEEQIKLTGSMENGVNVVRGNSAALFDAGNVLRGTSETVKELKGRMVDTASSSEIVLRGGITAITDFSSAFKALKIQLQDPNTGKQKEQIVLFQEAAQKLMAMKDAAERAAIAEQLFSRNWKQMLPVLANLVPVMDTLKGQFAKFHIGLEPEEILQSKKFNAAFETMKTTFERVKDLVFNELGQALVPIMNGLTLIVLENGSAWRNWAHLLVQDVKPAIEDLMDLITGRKAKPDTQAIQDLVRIFDQVKEAALVAFAVISFGFQAMVFVLDPIAALINEIFGTHLTGQTLAAAAVILQLVGVFGVLTSAIGTVVAVIAFIGAAIGTVPVAIGIAIAAGIAILYHFRDEIAAFATWLDQAISWDGMVAGFWKAVTWIKAQFSALMDWIRAGLASLTGGGGGGGGAPAPMATADIPAKAHGGRIDGPGGIDRVPIWATAGEFMMRTAAVAKYGLGFMHALNQGLLPLQGFALGGPIGPRASMHFAEGGVVGATGASTVINLSIDGTHFGGLVAPAHTAESLTRFARERQLVRAGRRPGWNGG